MSFVALKFHLNHVSCYSKQEEMDCNVTTALYLVTITTKLMSKATSQQEHNIYRHVFKLNRLNIRTKEGSSLLHLAASVDTPVDEFHTVDICRCNYVV